ncbi:glycosyltransferase family 25 protein [Ochrobactrum sp. GRS2]|nr:glycosyltransferase family 25 protein [Ochrobactrum sp. GRS2]
MKCYLINLDRAPERMARMSKMLSDLDIPFERVSAIDGQKFSQEELSDYRSQGVAGFDLSAGDIACGATHLMIMRKIIAGADEYAAVMEDDIYVSADAKHYLCSDSWIPQDADLVKLETSLMVTTISCKRIKLNKTRYLSRLLSHHSGAALYIISRKAAKEIVDRFTPGMDCIDGDVFGKSLHRHNIYQIVPALGRQAAAGTSKGEGCLISDIELQRGHYPDKTVITASKDEKPKGLKKVKRELIRSVTRLGQAILFTRLLLMKGHIVRKIPFKA